MAICSAPLEWPSRPGLATNNRGGPPGSVLERCATAASWSPRGTATPPTPVGARYSPNTSRRVDAHSPVVPPARANAIDASMMLRSLAAAACKSRKAVATACESRDVRQCCTSSMCAASTSGSTRMMLSLPPKGDTAVSVNELTPITVCSPLSMRRVRCAIDATRRLFNSSTAAYAPPSDNMSFNSACAASRISPVRRSTTCEPSKISSYSSKSVSNAKTCCIRSDHC